MRGMRSIAVCLIITCLAFEVLPEISLAAAVVGIPATDPVSKQIFLGDSSVIPAQLNIPSPLPPTEAVAKDVSGATGLLDHPTCVAEVNRRAALSPPQPPPSGDFPCVVPASNGAGVVNGMCFVTQCKGVSFTGLGGILTSIGTMAAIGGAVALVSKLLSSGQSAGGGTGAFLQNATGTLGCGAYAQTSTSTSPLCVPYYPQFVMATSTTGTDISLLLQKSLETIRLLLSALSPAKP